MVETGEMSSLKRKIDVMKSPTSLIRFRNAVGVMLALSAIFAVVLSTISLPSDETSAQTTDPVEERAKAWWALLENEERVNVLLGKEADHDTSTAGVRDLGDPDRTNTDPSVMYDENGNVVTAPAGTQGEEYSGVEQAQKDFDDQTTPNQDAIKFLVDGDTTNGSGDLGNQDLYAVGNWDIRGFQSVDVWWFHLTCQEARIALGEDNDPVQSSGYNDPFTTVADPDAEPSLCDNLLGVDQTKRNAVAMAILGLTEAGSANTGTNANAKAWWGELSAQQRADALYGAGTTIDVPGANTDGTAFTAARFWMASQDYDDITTSIRQTVEVNGTATELPLDGSLHIVITNVKSLINDRWEWIYNEGGANDDGIAPVIYWWNSIGCDEMLIATGADNERGSAVDGQGFCAMWDGLDDTNNTSSQGTDGQARQARVLELGQAIIGTVKPVPQIAAWWDTLLPPEKMVYVVYGNPPMRAEHDHDNDPNTPMVTDLTTEDEDVFKKLYDDLVAAEDIVPTTHLTRTPIEALLRRHGSRNGRHTRRRRNDRHRPGLHRRVDRPRTRQRDLRPADRFANGRVWTRGHRSRRRRFRLAIQDRQRSGHSCRLVGAHRLSRHANCSRRGQRVPRSRK